MDFIFTHLLKIVVVGMVLFIGIHFYTGVVVPGVEDAATSYIDRLFSKVGI